MALRTPPALISCRGVTAMGSSSTLIHLSDCQCDGLAVPDWSIQSGDGWCVFGRNGSGKQLIDQLLVGEIEPCRGVVERTLDPDQIALISFERQQATYEEVIASPTAPTATAADVPLALPEVSDSDHGAEMYYTSGTTGRPKGVVLSHKIVTLHALGCVVDHRIQTSDRWLHVAP